MQFSAVRRKSTKAYQPKKRSLGVFEAIITKYSQVAPTTPAAENLDPQAIQMGQSIYDQTGKEYVVVEDDPTTTYKTLMPADQQGAQMPEGVQTVEDSELQVDYNVQQPSDLTTASLAPEFKRT